VKNLKKFKALKEKEDKLLTKEYWKRINCLYTKLKKITIIEELSETVEKKWDDWNSFEKSIIEIELSAIIKESGKNSYHTVLKAENYKIYYHDLKKEIYVNDKEDIEKLSEQLKKEIEITNEVTILSIKNRKELPIIIEGENIELRISNIINFFKKDSINEKNYKIKIKKIDNI